ncbi:hypothetical protein [Vibrio sp. ER1A]|jgi:hypothetical protein|uniref:hypothetical protein n=1 Tax=Vibrio sp. ER1A TaxID=1517681 RepID=UPI0004DD8A93|nr:hypothetical protein [Vibrio sp. ER1A]KFA99594.1 hypothetical protein HW45_02705 [Vibrio sp. ER1A]
MKATTSTSQPMLVIDWNAYDFEAHAIGGIELIIELIRYNEDLHCIDPERLALALSGNMDILKASRKAIDNHSA